VSDRKAIEPLGLSADQLGQRLGVRLVTHVDVTSTMDVARTDTGPLPTVHVAERQSSGRGRKGRRWASPSGNLHATIVWPDPSEEFPPALLAALQLAWAESVDRHGGPPTRCKWPNDGYIAGRKWAGMLAARWPGRGALLIGVGANLRVVPEDVAPTATALVDQWPGWPGGKTVAEWLLEAAVGVLVSGPGSIPGILARWPQRDIWRPGVELEIESGGQVYTGRYGGLTASGELVLETMTGTSTFTSGDAHRVRAADHG
jgi:BirA family biotin operon repressor/biotin-[acetyl-CoA-carboxylase] ligase